VDLQLRLGDDEEADGGFDRKSASLRYMLYADQLLLITTLVRNLKEQGCDIRIGTAGRLSGLLSLRGMTDSRIRYASRIDFFKLLEMDSGLLENFTRRPGKDRFIELISYNKDNYFEVGKRIVQVVAAHTQVDKAVQHMLDFCLFEMMDNVLIHAAYPISAGGQGWCSAQYFPGLKRVRLMIADTGIGIHRALTKHPASRYKQLSASQALQACVQKGVTNGAGMGFGLYATRQFISLNQGELLIYSGEYYGTLKAGGAYQVKKGAYWQGTLVFLNIRTDVPVDYKCFMPGSQYLADDFDFIYGVDRDLKETPGAAVE
jgi:hypothetical protein